MVWSDIGHQIGMDGDIKVSRSTDNGLTWSDPSWLNSNPDTDTGSDTSPKVRTDGQHWLAVWQSNESSIGGGIEADYDILVSLSTDKGASWSIPSVLNSNAATDGAADWYPELETDGSGDWIAVWHSDLSDIGGGIGSDKDILVSTSSSVPVELIHFSIE